MHKKFMLQNYAISIFKSFFTLNIFNKLKILIFRANAENYTAPKENLLKTQLVYISSC